MINNIKITKILYWFLRTLDGQNNGYDFGKGPDRGVYIRKGSNTKSSLQYMCTPKKLEYLYAYVHKFSGSNSPQKGESQNVHHWWLIKCNLAYSYARLPPCTAREWSAATEHIWNEVQLHSTSG